MAALAIKRIFVRVQRLRLMPFAKKRASYEVPKTAHILVKGTHEQSFNLKRFNVSGSMPIATIRFTISSKVNNNSSKTASASRIEENEL
jgi:hypothetical protein